MDSATGLAGGAGCWLGHVGSLAPEPAPSSAPMGFYAWDSLAALLEGESSRPLGAWKLCDATFLCSKQVLTPANTQGGGTHLLMGEARNDFCHFRPSTERWAE